MVVMEDSEFELQEKADITPTQVFILRFYNMLHIATLVRGRCRGYGWFYAWNVYSNIARRS